MHELHDNINRTAAAAAAAAGAASRMLHETNLFPIL